MLAMAMAGRGGSDDAASPPTVYATYVLLAPAAGGIGTIAVGIARMSSSC